MGVEHVNGCDMRSCMVREGVANCVLRQEHVEQCKTLENEHMAFTVEFESVEEMQQCALACIEQSGTVQDATDEAFTWIHAIHRFLNDDSTRLQNAWFQLWQFGQQKFGSHRWRILHLQRDGFNPYTKRWMYVWSVPHR